MIAELSDCPWWLIFVLVLLPWAVVMWLGLKLAAWLDARERRAMAQRLEAMRAKQILTSFK